MSTVVAFVAVSVVVIVTPGQDTALVIKNTLAGGRAGGVATGLGVCTGLLLWALATSVGLAALVVASEQVFVLLKVLGALYLVYLGVRALSHAVRGRPRDELGTPGRALGRPAAFRQGLLMNLGNPKIAVFFTSLLPQFTSGGDGAFLEIVALGLVFCLMGLVWLTGYALVVDRASGVLRRPAVRRVLDAATGTVLVALGVRLATERS